MTAATPTRTSTPRGPVKRVLGWICGVVLGFVAAFWAITATTDLALSAGVYGTPGTYKVEACHDTNSSGKNSNYSCYGDFTPDGGTAHDAVYVHLKDTGHNYDEGTVLDVRQGVEPQAIQRTGFWGIVGELWQVGFATAVLGVLAYQVIKPRRESTRRTKIAERVLMTALVMAAIGLLSWASQLVQPS
ncbi:hypothetical protein P8605_29610 [Streptomyces sp. T-3]|nr:hypothetical protein [Streptomyces sp. T-3]